MINIHLVLVLHSCGGEKQANHAWQADSRSISAISNLVMKVYQQFRSIHARNCALQVYKFAHVALNKFLYILLPDSLTLSTDRHNLTLDNKAFGIFSELYNEIDKVVLAVKVVKVTREDKLLLHMR